MPFTQLWSVKKKKKQYIKNKRDEKIANRAGCSKSHRMDATHFPLLLRPGLPYQLIP